MMFHSLKKNLIKEPDRATKKYKLVIQIYRSRAKIRKNGSEGSNYEEESFYSIFMSYTRSHGGI